MQYRPWNPSIGINSFAALGFLALLWVKHNNLSKGFLLPSLAVVLLSLLEACTPRYVHLIIRGQDSVLHQMQ
jgi:hypothetical protein